MRYHWIFDTAALIGHANGTSTLIRAGLRMALDEPAFRLTVPATCLLEAYANTPPDTHPLLDGLAANPGVEVVAVGSDARTLTDLGELVRATGRAGAAHAAHLAMAGEGPCLVFSDISMPSGVLSRPA